MSHCVDFVQFTENPIFLVYLFYREYQAVYGKMLKLGLITRLIEGIPPYAELKALFLESKSRGHSLAIFDDCRSDLSILEPMYTIGSHHLNCSVITMSQTIFDEGIYGTGCTKCFGQLS